VALLLYGLIAIQRRLFFFSPGSGNFLFLQDQFHTYEANLDRDFPVKALMPEFVLLLGVRVFVGRGFSRSHSVFFFAPPFAELDVISLVIEGFFSFTGSVFSRVFCDAYPPPLFTAEYFPSSNRSRSSPADLRTEGCNFCATVSCGT